MSDLAKRLAKGALTLTTLVIVMLWATSRALEPEPAGAAVAPNPEEYREPVIQVYGADVWGWRGRFAIHTWVAVKPRDALEYTIYQVIGWRLRRTGSALTVSSGNPVRPWYGSPAMLLHDVRGADAAPLIERVEKAIEDYPFAREYTMYPGPNSNSFTAWVGLEVPELALNLPAKAIGQSWMRRNHASIRNSN